MQVSDFQQIKQRFGIVGQSEELNRAIDVAVQVAPTDLSVLITGESGVGKEFFPQIIHQFSRRKHGPYIPVNCGAIPEGTIDSELFGHEKGSFTGAMADRKGWFEAANGGTIFLDEVGELPLNTQVRLLRVLETGEFIKVGSSKMQKTDVRVIAATNLDMWQAVQKGRFREDLFYRLNRVPIGVPSLRSRKEDIVLLFRKFAADFAEKYRMPAIKLSSEAQALLMDYSFPGNIRQLKNITEQISVLEQNRDISAETLRHYLPEKKANYLPVLVGNAEKKAFDNEHEMLYQMLFDTRKELNELKTLVHSLMENVSAEKSNDAQVIYTPSAPEKPIAREPHVVDAEEYVEEELPSLNEIKLETIKKALEKHSGKRKYAAQDLGISERTLYRKIKEYNLDI